MDITKNTIISAAVTPQMLRKLDEYCDFWDMSRSEVVRNALDLILWIDNRQPATEQADTLAEGAAPETERS